MDQFGAQLTRIEKKLDSLTNDLHSLDKRLSIVESTGVSHQQNWDRWADLAFKVASTIVAAVLLFKLGIKP